MRVLIAEDSAQTRLLLQAAVEALGYACLVAEDGAEAWELFQSQGADVIISDRLMPRMDGLELCRLVRTHGPNLPYFIILTALDEKQQIMEGMQAGADDYLMKPPDLDELEIRLVAAERVLAERLQLDSYQVVSDPERLLADLTGQCASYTSRITLNGRSLTLDSAIKLIQQLPPDARVGRRGTYVFVDPDPFAPRDGIDHAPVISEVVKRRVEHRDQNRLIQKMREGATGDQRAEERRQGSWWRKLGNLVGGRSE